MGSAINDWPLSLIPAAIRCKELSVSPDDALKILAKNLDLPMEDAETVDFLRQALKATSDQIRLANAEHRVRTLKGEQ